MSRNSSRNPSPQGSSASKRTKPTFGFKSTIRAPTRRNIPRKKAAISPHMPPPLEESPTDAGDIRGPLIEWNSTEASELQDAAKASELIDILRQIRWQPGCGAVVQRSLIESPIPEFFVIGKFHAPTCRREIMIQIDELTLLQNGMIPRPGHSSWSPRDRSASASCRGDPSATGLLGQSTSRARRACHPRRQ